MTLSNGLFLFCSFCVHNGLRNRPIALERQPQPTRCRNEHEAALKEFVALRHQLVRERTTLKNQREHASQQQTVNITKELIKFITRRLKKVYHKQSKL